MTGILITITAARLAQLGCEVTTQSGDTVRVEKAGDSFLITGSGQYVDYTDDYEFYPQGFSVPVTALVPGSFELLIWD
jgi:hypothetical protein